MVRVQAKVQEAESKKNAAREKEHKTAERKVPNTLKHTQAHSSTLKHTKHTQAHSSSLKLTQAP